MQLPTLPGGIEANVRDVERKLLTVDLSRTDAMAFINYCLQFGALDVYGHLSGVTPETLTINDLDWYFADGATNRFHLLEQDETVDGGTVYKRLLVPGFDDLDYWQLLAGRLPYLKFTCDPQWHEALGKTSNTSAGAVVDALLMAELAALLPDPVWPPAD